MATDPAEQAKALAKSISTASASAAEYGHKPGPFVLASPSQRRRYLAAQAVCVKCGRKIQIDTEGVIKVPLRCV